VVGSYFATGARLVDEVYETLTLPGEPLEAPRFVMSAEWTLEQMQGFIASWSGTQKYIEERGENPADLIAPELTRLWGRANEVRTVRWPLYARVSRL
jgi:hypothetical protein